MPVKKTSNVKDRNQYEELVKQGMGKAKAARIANSDNLSSKMRSSYPHYEDWTKQELYSEATKLGIKGRSGMKKDELIQALRNR